MNILTNMNIGKRLTFAFGILLAMVVVGTTMAVIAITMVNNAMDETLKETRMMLLGDNTATQIQLVYLNLANVILHDDPTGQQEHLAELNTAREAYAQILSELKAAATLEEDQQLVSNLEEAVKNARANNDQAIELALSGKHDEASVIYNEEAMSNYTSIEKALNDLDGYRQQRMNDTDAKAEQIVAFSRTGLIVLVFIALLFAVFVSYAITRSISKPIEQSAFLLNEVAQGKLATAIPADLINRRDEIGKMGHALAQLIENMKGSLTEIKHSAATLASASTELSSISEEVTLRTNDSSNRANQVAAAAEEMSANTLSVAAGMDQAASSLASVATATEEMTATIGEIASNSEKARSTTLEAARQADNISATMKGLGHAANEIGKVTETITSISAQTNLLALNATIEAARAGAAGKGFAVVANEIKELAQQTAAATGEIKGQITNVQNSTNGAVADIQKIVMVIREVNDIVTSIASAIEEQSVVTRDIARNIAHASSDVKDANYRVSQTATVSQSIAEDINNVSQTTGEMNSASRQVQTSSVELSRLAEQLNGLIAMYKL